MLIESILLLSVLLPSASSWDYAGWSPEWGEHWPTEWQQSMTEGCTVSHLTTHEMEKGRKPVFFSVSPLDDPEAPKMLPLNSTGGEQWEFDGVSEDGLLAFCIGFYRDPNYAILGTGNLRLSAEFAYANGTRFVRVDYPTDSIVESCPGFTRGIWKSKDYSYTFEISKDMNIARIGMDAEDLKGSALIKSVTAPRYPDGTLFPRENATTEPVPYFHWIEPIPVGDIFLDVEIEGRPYQFKGLGGHERLWTAFSWFTCLSTFSAIRIKAGPYALTHVSYGSAIDKEIYRPSVVLWEDGKHIFSATAHEPSDTEDYAVLERTYGGKVTGNLKDKTTGFELIMVSPTQKKQWSFTITNQNLGFEYMLGEGVGGTGFSGTAVGGPIGLKQFFGAAFAESLVFPKKSYLFKPNYVDEL
uniref:Diels-Alderase n=1 Tax=Discosia rubi TaxID=2502037 RepID=A0A6M6I6B3_9PEZI|nr:Diels-Alderase [Discosia rubi]